MIRFGREICCDLEQAERREWWLSNGLGAYAAGNIAGSLTRRYHGLLVTPLDGALDRHLLLSKADATLEVDGQMYPLNCNRWLPGTVSPKGYTHIESFRLDGQLPVWTYAVAGVRLEHRIFMEQGEAAVWVAFRLLDASPDSSIKLHLRLLVNYRDHHGQTVSGSILPHPQLLDGRRMQLGYVGTHQLHMQLSTGEFQLEQHWINNFLLTHERERGLADVDNHLAIATAVLPLQNRLHNFIWHGLRAGLSQIGRAHV